MAIKYLSGITVDSTVLVVDSANDRVGIGTASPTEKLHIYGSAGASELIKVENSGTYLIYFGLSSGNEGYIGSTNATPLNILTNYSSRIYITTSGNVGVGTTAPGYLLHVSGSSYFDGNMGINGEGSGVTVDTGYGNNGRVGFMKYGGLEGMLVAGSDTLLRLGHRTDNAVVAGGTPTIREDLVITSAGNVGIGTTSPSQKLQVEGKIYARPYLPAVLSGAGDPYYGTNLTLATDIGQTQGAVRIWSRYNTGGTAAMTFEISSTDQSYNSDPQLLTYSEKMRITSSGNVGIGTTSPSEKLHVNGNIIIPQNNYIYFDNTAHYLRRGASYVELQGFNGIYLRTSNSNRVTITETGNVGIGTTSPGSALHVVSGGVASQGTSGISAMTAPGVWIGGDGTNGLVYNRNGGSWVPSYYDSSALYLNAQSGGNVGIGTTSPSYKLDVNGETRLGKLITTWSNSPITPSAVMYSETGYNTVIGGNGQFSTSYLALMTTGNMIYSGGNVGIGTTSPAYKLDVSGSGRFTSNLYVNNANGTAIVNAYSGGQIGTYLAKASSATANFTTTGVSYPRGLGFGAIIGQGNTTDIPVKNSSWNGGFGGLIGFWSDLDYGAEGGTNAIGYNAVIKGTGASNSYGFFADLTGATDGTRYGIYTKGEQYNYFSGNVGIGTTSPSKKLHVYNSGPNQGLRVSNLDGINMDVLSGANGGIVGTYSNHPLSVYTNSTERVTVTAGGNVGIGTTSPSSLSGYVAQTIDGTNGSFTEYRQNGTALFRIGADISRPFIYGMTNAPMDFYTNTNLWMRITALGNVGIGTTSPSFKTTISADITKSGDINPGTAQLSLEGATTPGKRMILGYDTNSNGFGFIKAGNYGVTWTPLSLQPDGGNVGIGTTSPADKLYVGNTAGTSISVSTNLAAGTNGSPLNLDFNFRGYADQKMAMIRSWDESASTGDGHLTFWTNDFNGTNVFTEKMRIGPTGSIKLNLYGSGTFTGTATQRLAVDASGNVIEIPIGSGPVDGSGTANYVTKWSDADTITNSIIYDNGSTVSIGLGATAASTTSAYGSPQLAVESNLFASSQVFTHNNTDGNFSFFALGKSKGTAASPTIVESSETIGMIQFWAYDGAAYRNTAFISNKIDGTPGAGDMPGNLIFATTNDGSSSASEKMRITNSGNVGIGTTAPAEKLDLTDGKLRFTNTSSGRNSTIGMDDNFNFYIKNTPLGSLYLGNGTTTYINGAFSAGSNSVVIQTGGNVGIGNTAPTQKLHVTGSVRVTGAFIDSNNEAGTSGQVLTSTGSGTDWVTPATTTASSLYDLLPAARVAYDWTVQMTSGTWADIFSSNTVLSSGTWMVQVYVSDFASGGQQYQETYSGVISWGNASSTNQGGASAISEVVLHRSGHAANAGNFYLRTQERASSTLLLQGMINYSHTSNTTINFKFVKIF